MGKLSVIPVPGWGGEDSKPVDMGTEIAYLSVQGMAANQYVKNNYDFTFPSDTKVIKMYTRPWGQASNLTYFIFPDLQLIYNSTIKNYSYLTMFSKVKTTDDRPVWDDYVYSIEIVNGDTLRVRMCIGKSNAIYFYAYA